MSKIVVHTCCSDCLLKLLDALYREFGYSKEDILLYFNNPNIHPEAEWLARKAAVQKTAKENGLQLRVVTWQPRNYFESINKLIDQNLDIHDRSIRCPQCYLVRLSHTAAYASEIGVKAFSSTMLTSTYLFNHVVKKIGEAQAEAYNMTFVVPQSIDSCLHTSGFYKQNYCGCIYSLESKYKEKYIHGMIKE